MMLSAFKLHNTALNGTINCLLKWIWNKVVLAYLSYYLGICLEELREITLMPTTAPAEIQTHISQIPVWNNEVSVLLAYRTSINNR